MVTTVSIVSIVSLLYLRNERVLKLGLSGLKTFWGPKREKYDFF